MALADMDGDGDLDVVTIDSSNDPGATGRLVVMRNDGTGALSVAGSASNVQAGKKVVTGDWNMDGKMDAAVANATAIAIFLGDGACGLTFSSYITMPPIPPPFPGPRPILPYPTDLAAADFNKDGRVDLVVSLFPGNQGRVLLSNGNATFNLQNAVSTPFGSSGVAAGDINGDGNQDAVFSGGSSSDDQVRVYYGNGSGGFSSSNSFGTQAGAPPTGVEVGDINGDGRVDAVTIHNNNLVVAMLNNASGGLAPAASIGVSSSPGDLAIADLDGDGHGEILVTELAAKLNILSYTNAALTHVPPSPLATTAWYVAAGQMNGSGLADVVAGQPGRGITVFINGGAAATAARK